MNVAAIFDIDGTLVQPPSLERRFLSFLRWRGIFRWSHFTRCAAPLVREAWRAILAGEWAGMEYLTAGCKIYLAGVPVRTMDIWLGWLVRNPIKIIPKTMQRIEWHARQGHRIILLSGALAPIATAVARLLPVPVHVCATELEIENSRFTGCLRGEAIAGPGKARALLRLAAEFSLDLQRSYAYGDSLSDRWMLERVGNPFVVQCTERFSWTLANMARQRKWPVLRWGAANNGNEFIGYAELERERKSNVHSAILGAQAKSG